MKVVKRFSIPGLGMLVVLVIAIATAACYTRVRTVEVAQLTATTRTDVRSPLKVHMSDGSVILFRFGATVTPDSIFGTGERFDALQNRVGAAPRVALDSVLGITNFWNGTNVSGTVALTAGGTLIGAAASLALFKALFGSCPTFYTDADGAAVLEAEGFSYSIAPLFESRDLDALRGRPRAGVYTIEMRNEALETHYINHLELLVFEHPQDARVLPDGRGNLTTVAASQPPRTARDRNGRDVVRTLATNDDRVFESSPARMRNVRADDLMDYIDMDFGVAESDSAAITVRLRNSLLTTVLFYELMLAGAGAEALDWMAQDLEKVGNAAELGKWYVERMGLRVLVEQDGQYVEAGRIPDVGPIAWKDVAVRIPARKGASLKVRIEFPADSWRIDRIALAQNVRAAVPTVVPVSRVRHVDGSIDAKTRNAVSAADDAYLITEPGRRVFFEFDVPQSRNPQSFVLASHGYYSEWMRPDWLRRPTQKRFQASDTSLLEAMQFWRANSAQLEQTFYTTKIPTH